jgi:hypothetical protein
MPSNSMDNCARVNATCRTLPFGHTKRPRSSRFANRHNPSFVPPQQLDQIPAPPAENETLTGERIFFENCLYQCAQPGEAASQIRYSSGNPDLRSCRQPNHRTSPSRAARTQAGIGTAFDPNSCMPQIDVDHAGPRCRRRCYAALAGNSLL